MGVALSRDGFQRSSSNHKFCAERERKTEIIRIYLVGEGIYLNFYNSLKHL
jgi:hypothetical protein